MLPKPLRSKAAASKMTARVETLDTYIIHNICPSFQCDTLEYSEACQANVIKVSDTTVGTIPGSFAHLTICDVTMIAVTTG